MMFVANLPVKQGQVAISHTQASADCRECRLTNRCTRAQTLDGIDTLATSTIRRDLFDDIRRRFAFQRL